MRPGESVGAVYSFFLSHIHDQYVHRYGCIILFSHRKRKPIDEVEDEEDDEEQSIEASVGDEVEGNSSRSQEEEKIVRKWPTDLHKCYDWGRNGESFDRSEFQSVDGDKIFHYNSWHRRHELSYGARVSLERGQSALLKKQDERFINLDCKFLLESKLTQVPYRKSLQCYAIFLRLAIFGYSLNCIISCALFSR
jgi:hypothetical protein